MKLTCLVENTTQNPNLIAEHGLCVYMETFGKKILLDFGQSGQALLHNAAALGIELSAVDFAVLSHGHYDHGGGLSAFLEVNKTARVYLSQNAFGEYYNGTEKYIGLDTRLQGNSRLCFVGEDTQIAQGITLRFPKNKLVAPPRHGGLTQKVREDFFADDFSHELYLEVEEQNQKILLSGCAHKGIENIMAWFSPTVFVGGMHLSRFPLDDSLEQIANILKGYNTHYITGHCTGEEQAGLLKERLGTVTYFSCGSKCDV